MEEKAGSTGRVDLKKLRKNSATYQKAFYTPCVIALLLFIILSSILCLNPVPAWVALPLLLLYIILFLTLLYKRIIPVAAHKALMQMKDPALIRKYFIVE